MTSDQADDEALEPIPPQAEADRLGSGVMHPDRKRAIAGVLVFAIVLAGAGFAIYRQRQSFVDTLQHVGVWTILASYGCGLVGVAGVFPIWRNVLRGLGVELPLGHAAGVFFTSQLGKYLPGSVWPVLLQMEAGRARGARRRTMLNASVILVVLNCCIGLSIGCLLVPLYDASAFTHYWWVLIALPFLVGLLHPRALPALLDRIFGLLGRPPLGEHLDGRSELRAAAWSVVTWIGLGAHLGVLSASIGHRGLSAYVLSTGAMALAVSLGVLFIPAPAGVGIRDIVLVLVLTTIMPSGSALAVVVASRVILIICDVTLAGVGALIRRGSHVAVSRP
jgi:uncharacterized membrane protein YbhN (UPF0104 family)